MFDSSNSQNKKLKFKLLRRPFRKHCIDCNLIDELAIRSVLSFHVLDVYAYTCYKLEPRCLLMVSESEGGFWLAYFVTNLKLQWFLTGNELGNQLCYLG